MGLGESVSLTGAALWLVFARFWVPREMAAGFFLVNGLGWFSAVSRWLYEGAGT